jgi:4a-hydroxytetrahydrobiopterin dehydratase
MPTSSTAELASKKCVPCEGGVEKYSPEEARAQLASLEGWQTGPGAESIFRRWTVKNFAAGMEFLRRVADLAEQEDHHPDLHLEGYRNVRIELSTHAIGGLSENDFILAAKINELPVEVKE